MTESFWNSEKIRTSFPECATLKDIIARLESDFVIKGEVICEIRVNGVLLNEGDETRLADMGSGEIRNLEIRSNQPANLIADAVKSALVLVPDLDRSCVVTAERFRSSDIAAAQRSFHECLEGCQWLVDTLIHVRGAASGTRNPISQPERWFEAEKLIARVIREISEAYTRKDYVLVADLLEYELTGVLSAWREAIEIEDRARGALGAGPQT